jgi:hypothetical protein
MVSGIVLDSNQTHESLARRADHRSAFGCSDLGHETNSREHRRLVASAHDAANLAAAQRRPIFQDSVSIFIGLLMRVAAW